MKEGILTFALLVLIIGACMVLLHPYSPVVFIAAAYVLKTFRKDA